MGRINEAASVGRINRAATEGRIRIVATEGRIPIVVIDMEDIPIVVTGTEVIHIGAMGDIHTMVRIFIIAEASGWIRDWF